MKKILSVFIILTFCCGIVTPAFAAIKGDEQTDSIMLDNKILELSNKYLAVLSSMFPEAATRAGISGYHATLEARDQQEQVIRTRTMQGLKEALEKIDVKKLSTDRRLDYYILLELVDEKIFEMTVANQLANDPSWYLEPIDSIYELLLKDFAPKADRVTDALKRLEALPAVFKEAKRNVENPPDLRLRLAIEKASAAYSGFTELNTMFNNMAADEYTKGEVKKAINAAKIAVKDYHDFLKELMLSKNYVDFRLGKENFNKLYTQVYKQKIPLNKFPKSLNKEVENAKNALILALTPIIEPAFTEEERAKRTNKKGLIEIAPVDYYIAKASFNKYVAVKNILNTYAKGFSTASTFLSEKKYFPVAPIQVVVARAPKYLENKLGPVTYIRPYPLVSKGMGDVLVTVPTSAEIKKNTAKMYTEGDIKFSIAKSMTPGQNLMYSFTDQDGQILKRLSNDKFFINGWEKYALNLAAEAGFLSTPEDKLNLAWYNYKKALWAVVDYKMQMMEFNYTQALEYLVSSGLKKEEAEVDVDYLALNPLDGISALMGEQELDKLRIKYQKKLGKKFELIDYHKKLLSVGRVPLLMIDDSLSKSYEDKPVESFFNTIYF